MPLTPGSQKGHQDTGVLLKMSNSEHATTCPVCATAIEPTDQIKLCPACETPHHCDCWEYNEGCAIYGCTSVATTNAVVPAGAAPALSQGFTDIESLPKLKVSPDVFIFELGQENSLLFNILSNIRILVPALFLINLLAFLTAGSAKFLFAYCFLYTSIASLILAFSHSFYSTKIRFRPTSNQMVKEAYFGSFHIGTQVINLKEIDTINIGTAIRQSGIEHQKVLRLSIDYKSEKREIAYLNLDECKVPIDQIDNWALILRSKTTPSILKAAIPKSGLLQRRIAAFELFIEKAQNSLEPSENLWNKKHLFAIANVILLTGAAQMAGFAAFTGAHVMALTLILCFFYLFFRPEEFYSNIRSVFYGKKSYITPEPDPLMFFNEEESVNKLSNFMTRVEESKFASLMTSEEKTSFHYLTKGLLIVPTVSSIFLFLSGPLARTIYSQGLYLLAMDLGMIIFPPAMVLFAMVWGAHKRASWNEEWAIDWLKDSRKALENLDYHKEKEQAKLLEDAEKDTDDVKLIEE